MEEISPFLLALYRAARELAPEDFRPAALRRLQTSCRRPACCGETPDGLRLPSVLRGSGQEKQVFVHLGKHARIDVRRVGELVYLSGRRKTGRELLTPRQLQVARMFAQGLSSKALADALGLSPSTVRNHLAQIYDVLQVHGRQAMSRRLEEIRG